MEDHDESPLSHPHACGFLRTAGELNGVRVLKAETVAAMTHDQVRVV